MARYAFLLAAVFLAAVFLAVVFLAQPAEAAPRIVAAESVYADIARQLAGPAADVTAILANPAQDPHLFEATPAVARSLTRATIVIYNGAGYDPWMRDLLAATAGAAPRRVIDVADLVHAGADGNPHLWYGPGTMPALAQALSAALQAVDPPNAAAYRQRLATLQTSLAALATKIAALRSRHAGQPVTATEPVFGLMLQALALQDRNAAFQRAIMNDTEPGADAIAAMESDLRFHRVRALIRNSQTDDDTTRRLVAIARNAHVPVLLITESEPPHTGYQAWVGAQLDALDQALNSRP